MQDWDEPRDKGPLNEERPKHYKSRKGKKLFIIEHYYTGECGILDMYSWTVFKRYKTEKQRDQAFERLNRQDDNWKYRIREQNTKRQQG